MPQTNFSSLPDTARLWVFACDPAPSSEASQKLLSTADQFLASWQAHGNPLTSARDWREGRFLAIAVDQTQAGASGCSIDGLFRALKSLESTIGSRLVSGGSVFYRESNGGDVQCASREEFSDKSERGEISASTKVFDTSVVTARDWRSRFELEAGESWHASLMP